MIQIKVCVPWLLLEVRRRDEAVRGFDSNGFFALAGETGFLQRHRLAPWVTAKAGIPLLFRQHPAGKLPQRRDESIGF
ncbi:hypothetical protein ACOJBM_12415 [Rhizobium beringeri]|uniref:Uncharacterized protein n=2 Tax=Rhizobium TaxID=379 RepID=A0A444HX45_RHILE|nr:MULTISPECIES: hypothetical protein [Rhizobium]MBY5457599.1 hypothetical protein [Rhizobium leguminosarum]NKL65299.1 hypothetical protein [Rhizobium leguminosarum bv. viciae]RWX28526.1 hypothetical protein EHI47_18970 [Rhizobium leguminosarum]TAU53474.1 hypothetical protein ELI43_12010 [Rhizobium leguminosarum]TBC73494.1 hypothetical protein ELH27_11830 [Rhizobium leguminosarum]